MLINPLIIFVIFISLFVVSILLTHLMLARIRILDIANERSSHRGATPKSGGIAIVCCFIITLFLLSFVFNVIDFTQPIWFVFALCAIGIAVLSFLDDVYDISAKLRLFAHTIFAILLVGVGWSVETLFMPFGEVSLGAFSIFVSFLWVLGLTNACNFIDGIDGLVTSIVAIALFVFTIINYSLGNVSLMFLSLGLLAGCSGFLLFNWPPAKIFLGDVGSAFLGFVLAALALYGATLAPNKVDFWLMPLLLGHLLFDAILTFLRRLIRGDNVLKAHREHLYQLLVRSGLTHMRVTMIAIYITLFNAFAALYMLTLAPQNRFYILLLVISIQIIYALWVLRRAKNSLM